MADVRSNLPTKDAADGTDGATAPSVAIHIAGKDGSGNLQSILTDTSGGVIVAGQGVAGTPAGGVLSVQGVSGGVALGSRTLDGSGNTINSTGTSLNVNVTNSFASGTVDKGAFVYGVGIANAIAGVYQDTAPSLTAGTQGAIRVTQNRGLHINLRNDSGTEVGTSSTPLRIDPTGTTPQPASQSGSWSILNISGTISLPTGASTSALQTTGNASIASIDTKTPTLGQKTMANSTPVVIASDQSAVPVSQSGTWNITNVSGTVSLPTGASTSALQTTGNTSLGNIDTKMTDGTQRTKLTDGSNNVAVSNAAPVGTEQGLIVRNIPSGTQNVSVTASVLPTGAATAANQASQITLETSISNTSNTTAINSAAILANQTNGTQKTLVTDLTGAFQPAGDALARSIFVRVGDGTTGGTVKAASTAPLATDTALVVALSPNGAQATAALQTTGNASIASIDTKTPTLGQKTMANSTPVVIASDQTAFPITLTKTALTGSSPTSASVAITSGSAVAANANRKGLVITNLSSARVSFGIGVAAVLSSGITLLPGGVWVMDEYTYSVQVINAIASVAASAISIQEFT